MAITKEELEKLINVKPRIERVATISSDGKNLLLRIPKEIRDAFGMEKGDKARFFVDENNRINFEVIKIGSGKKEKGA